jgi:hypothetical protein
MTYENTPEITTERLILRRFTGDDAAALLEQRVKMGILFLHRPVADGDNRQ